MKQRIKLEEVFEAMAKESREWRETAKKWELDGDSKHAEQCYIQALAVEALLVKLADGVCGWKSTAELRQMCNPEVFRAGMQSQGDAHLGQIRGRCDERWM